MHPSAFAGLRLAVYVFEHGFLIRMRHPIVEFNPLPNGLDFTQRHVYIISSG